MVDPYHISCTNTAAYSKQLECKNQSGQDCFKLYSHYKTYTNNYIKYHTESMVTYKLLHALKKLDTLRHT